MVSLRAVASEPPPKDGRLRVTGWIQVPFSESAVTCLVLAPQRALVLFVIPEVSSHKTLRPSGRRLWSKFCHLAVLRWQVPMGGHQLSMKPEGDLGCKYSG